MFGSKHSYKEIVEIRWPDYDAIILNCPHCSQPIATTKEHRIVSIEQLHRWILLPLTICPVGAHS